MTIEIADRLIKLRKKNGYSQEELADKLGLSRQAISKWERAEASPDTDNLICLAKLYGVSLDELLSTEDDVETIVKEQIKEEDKQEEPEGVHLVDDEGNKVIIGEGKIELQDKDGNKVEKKPFKDRFGVVLAAVESTLFLLTVVLYILLGTFLGMWHNGWIFLFVPGIICSIVRAIKRKNANRVNVPFIAVFTYFFVCLLAPGLGSHLWHPLWVIFLIIPVYYSVVGVIHKATNRNLDDDDKKED